MFIWEVQTFQNYIVRSIFEKMFIFIKIFKDYIKRKLDCFLKRDLVCIYMINQTQPLHG